MLLGTLSIQANFKQARTTASQVVDKPEILSFDNVEALILLLILCMVPQHLPTLKV